MNDLYRVEAVEIVINRGLVGEWARDHCHAHGAAAQRNPLGHALSHLEASIRRNPGGDITYSGHALYMAKYLLAGALIKDGVCSSRDSMDWAEYGLSYFLGGNCPVCHGSGVINIEQTQCSACGGTGKKQKSEVVSKVMKVIEFYREWMEGQLNKKLRRSVSDHLQA